MAEKKEVKEEKEVKVNLSFTSEKLFLYGAIADAVIGFIWGICGAINSTGAHQASGFFQGLFFAVLGGLVLYGLSLILSRKQ
jgi:hypothetical protein